LNIYPKNVFEAEGGGAKRRRSSVGFKAQEGAE